MKVVIAPDSFKGSLSASDAGQAIRTGILQADPNCDITIIPMADGGEGTLEAILTATAGTKVAVQVLDPLGREITANFALLENNTCIIEMAQACGLYLLKDDERNPLYTSTYGFGQLIQAALGLGCRHFILTLGGSATNDAGVGMLQALGFRFLDQNGDEVGHGGVQLGSIQSIDRSQADTRLEEASFIIACDVDNPFIGARGASYVYAPQKGATPEMVEFLEQNMVHLADLIEANFQIRIHDIPGAGAAGGVAGGILVFLNSHIESGIKLISRITQLEQAIRDADLVFTGEGQIDAQTSNGKTAFGVAKLAQKYRVPVVALVGAIGHGIDRLQEHGFTAIYSIMNKPMNLEEAMEQTHGLLAQAAEQVMRLCKHFRLSPITKEIIQDRQS